MSHTATPQQEAIYRFFEQDPGSLIVEACAGAGKTTTLLNAVSASSDPTTLVCAFNKRIELDLKAKLEGRPQQPRKMIDVRTLHSLGLKLLGSYWHGVEIDKRATSNLVKLHFNGPARARFHVVRLVDHVKDVHPHLHEHPREAALPLLQAIVMQQVNDPAIITDPALVAQIAIAVLDVMEASLLRRPGVDYADMVWLPVALDLQPRGRFRRVLVDEVQDLSLGQFELLERFVAPGGGLVAFGDRWQAIYGWRGAACNEIWRRMLEDYQAKVLPLTVSFRCAKAVIRAAKVLVPQIEARPGAPEGIVDEIDEAQLLAHAKPGDFILSRANAPLVTLAVDAWLKGCRPVIEGGRELGGPLFDILDKLSISSPAAYRNSLDLWHREQVAKAQGAEGEWTDSIDDYYALLQGVGERVGPKRVAEVLRTIFAIEAPRTDLGFGVDLTQGDTYLSFSTVHKAKGLEASRVFLLRQSFRRWQPRDGHEVPLDLADVDQEELNVEYVGTTRAIDRLTWVNLATYKGPISRGSALSGRASVVRSAKTDDVARFGDRAAAVIDAHVLAVDGAVRATIIGPIDAVLDTVVSSITEPIAMKHHGEIPNEDRSFLGEPKQMITIRVAPTDVEPALADPTQARIARGKRFMAQETERFLRTKPSVPVPPAPPTSRRFGPAKPPTTRPARVFPPAIKRKP